MVTTVNKKIIECDICKKTEEFSFALGAPKEWWVIRFANDGTTRHSFDMCPNCTEKVMKYVESISQEVDHEAEP